MLLICFWKMFGKMLHLIECNLFQMHWISQFILVLYECIQFANYTFELIWIDLNILPPPDPCLVVHDRYNIKVRLCVNTLIIIISILILVHLSRHLICHRFKTPYWWRSVWIVSVWYYFQFLWHQSSVPGSWDNGNSVCSRHSLQFSDQGKTCCVKPTGCDGPNSYECDFVQHVK